MDSKVETFLDNIWHGKIGNAEKTILERIYNDVYGPDEVQEESKEKK